MDRIQIEPRENWQEKMEEVGFKFHTLWGETYWDETAYYRFTSSQIDKLDDVTQELYDICLAGVELVIRENLFEKLRIPSKFIPYIQDSWTKKQPSLYGRFDLWYDGYGEPKMYEFNADTPTALIEASVAQWFWLQDRFPKEDQFNSLHEKLIQRWKSMKLSKRIHFACALENEEDLGNVEYIRDTAISAGLHTALIDITDIGWDKNKKRFVDLENLPIESIFKLYPWEWMVREEFSTHLLEYQWNVLEPPWKMILSNKAFLAILWEMYPGHPNLLPTFFSSDPLTFNYVKKPIYSREGENVEIYRSGKKVLFKEGEYGREGFVYQEYKPVPNFNGNFPVIGSWIIGDETAGIGIREDSTEITTNAGRFIPHLFIQEF